MRTAEDVFSLLVGLAFGRWDVRVATADAVYIGGSFTNVSGVTRTRLAAIRPSNGAVLDWAPSASGGGNQVMALALTTDRSKLIVGGNYTVLNGNSALGLGAVNPATGATASWNAARTVQNAGLAAAITSLVASNDSIYGTGYVSGTDPGLPKGNLEGSFSASAATGDIRWVSSCHGDSYSVFPLNGASYSVGHPHDCRDIRGFPQTNPWTYQRALAVTDSATQTSRKNITRVFVHISKSRRSTINWVLRRYTAIQFHGAFKAHIDVLPGCVITPVCFVDHVF